MTETGSRQAVDLPLVLAHRGASADERENTVAAFAEARRQGADGVELDVRRSGDGVLVVHHDVALGDGRVVAHTPAADLPAWLPTLAEALDACRGLLVNVEIKNTPADADHDPECRVADEVAALLATRRSGEGAADDVLVSSFHLATLDRFRAVAPHVPTALLTFLDPPPVRAVTVAADRGHSALHPHVATVDADLVDAAHDAGLAVNVWTVDDPDLLRSLAALGVDGLVTNVPGIARRALRDRPLREGPG